MSLGNRHHPKQGSRRPRAPPWSEHEDRLICQLRGCGAGMPAIIAQIPNRTPDAIARRVQNLIKKGRIERRTFVDPRRKRWSNHEDDVIQRMRARGSSFSEIAAKLNRTRNAVALRTHDLIALGKVERLGPRRAPKRWTEEDDRQLDLLRNEGRSMQEVARLLGRTIHSINDRVTAQVQSGKLKRLRDYQPRRSGC